MFVRKTWFQNNTVLWNSTVFVTAIKWKAYIIFWRTRGVRLRDHVHLIVVVAIDGKCQRRVFLTVNLRLPYGVANTPQTGGHEEFHGSLGVRFPDQHPRLQTGVHEDSQTHNRRSSDIFHDRSKQEAAYRVNATEADHDVADLGNAQGAGYVRLREIGTDKRLLHSDENRYGNQQLLIWFLQLISGGG